MNGITFHYITNISTFFPPNIREYKELYILLLIDKNRKEKLLSFSVFIEKKKHDYNKNNFLMIKVVEQHDYNQHKNPLKLFYII